MLVDARFGEELIETLQGYYNGGKGGANVKP